MSEKNLIQSIERASLILEFVSAKGSAKLNEICEETGLKTSTAFRIIQTLEHTGQLTRTDTGLAYSLGFNSLKYGLSCLDGSIISDKAHELLVRLAEEIGETAYFELKVGARYYYLDYVVSPHSLKVVPDENRFIDLPDNSAVSKVYNNYSDDFTYATDLEEVDEGLNCFAVPYKIEGKIAACVALTGPSYRFTKEKMEVAYEVYRNIMTELALEKHL